MKILIASDLHGSKEASEKLVSLDQKYKFSKIIFTLFKSVLNKADFILCKS